MAKHVLPNAEDVNGNTPLHYALAQSGDVDLDAMKILVEAGADVNKLNAYFQTPLAVACKQHQFMYNAIPILLKAGADPTIQSKDGNTSLHLLFFGTNLFEPNLTIDVVNELVQANKKCLEIMNLYGELPIHGALSKRQNEEIAFLLLKYAPNTSHVCDKLGRTVLHFACERNYVSILKWYLETTNYQELVNKTDHHGRTILHYSCMFTLDGESVKAIMECRNFQKCDMTDCFGQTAYQYAMTRRDDCKTVLAKLFDSNFENAQHNICKLGTNHIDKYLVVEETKPLNKLLSVIEVNGTNVLPASLRPIANAEDYVEEIWKTCRTPIKHKEMFVEKRKMVETFMNNLIKLMGEQDERFSGSLVMRGSAYEETVADERGDFDYMLNIDELSLVCAPVTCTNDPPGFVRLQLKEGQGIGKFGTGSAMTGSLKQKLFYRNSLSALCTRYNNRHYGYPVVLISFQS